MKFGRKVLTSLCAAAVMVSCMAVGAAAATNSKQIQALLDYGITVKYNGQAQQLKDVNGNAVYPITYNGTTYLPVRAAAGLVNLPVDWDGDTRTVLLGEKDKTPVTADMWTTCRDRSVYTTDQSKLVIDGQAYASGVLIPDPGFSHWLPNTVGYLNVGGKYDTLHVLACSNADMVLYFNDGDVLPEMVEEIELKAGVPTPLDIYIAGVEQVCVEVSMLAIGDPDYGITLVDMYLK